MSHFSRESIIIRGREKNMKKRKIRVLIIAGVALCTFGCDQYVLNTSNVRCPKCGAVFTIDEGIQDYQRGL